MIKQYKIIGEFALAIKTPTSNLTDEDCEIKEGDIRWETKDKDCYKTTQSDFEDQNWLWYKVFATSNPQKAIEYSIPLYEVENYMNNEVSKKYEKFEIEHPSSASRISYMEGYKAARQTYLFTEEDVKNAIKLSLKDAEKSVLWSETYPDILANKIIQSLKEKILEVEWEDLCDYEGEELWEITANWQPKNTIEIIDGREVTVLTDYKII